MEIWGFRIFPFGLVVDPITVQNFNFLGHLEVPEHFAERTNAQRHKGTNTHTLPFIYIDSRFATRKARLRLAKVKVRQVVHACYFE